MSKDGDSPKKRPHFQPLVQHVLELANGREQGNSRELEPVDDPKMGWVQWVPRNHENIRPLI